MALLIVPITAAFGMTLEAGNWYLVQRAAQNAADTAAIAAATNGGTVTAAGGCAQTPVPGTFDCEAEAAAARYGFSTSDPNVSFTPGPQYFSAPALCPGGTANTSTQFGCYLVTIQKKVPLSLLKVVGYNGDTTINGEPAKLITASAWVTAPSQATTFCIRTIKDFTVSGGGNAQNFGNCSIYAGGDATCSGSNSDYQMFYGYAAGTSGCGQAGVSTHGAGARSGWSSPPYDPWKALAAPSASGCSTGPIGPATFSANSQVITRCGAVGLTSDITITNSNVELIVANGDLDLNGHTLSTAGGGSLTILFVSSCTGGCIAAGGGALNITAPTSGTWSGVAVWVDSAITNNTMTFGPGGPNLSITGVFYAPGADLTTHGSIGGGGACSIWVLDSLTINGSGAMATAPNGCASAGVSLPSAPRMSFLAMTQ